MMKYSEMEFTTIEGGICQVPGFKAAGMACGIKKCKGKKDLAIICADTLCNAAGVYTKNLVKAAPVKLTKTHLENGKAAAVIVNSGNANACAPKGMENAMKMCEAAGKALGLDPQDIIVASTGIIGVELPVECVESKVPELAESLTPEGEKDAMEAILTTDTYTKSAALSLELGGKKVTVGGFCKGSGMIHPNMGTMLGFIGTDAAIESEMLQEMLVECVEKSFNRISVDGDTSTNDMVCLLANGKAGNKEICHKGEEYQILKQALLTVCVSLSKKIAGDGEGAGRLFSCTVFHAATEKAAEGLAKSVITSSLVKTAIFGKDANWGRVLCALGYAGEELDPDTVDVFFQSKEGKIQVCRNGEGIAFDEDLALAVLSPSEIGILVDLKAGAEEVTAWGCDLTYDYVKINGDYRS